MIALYLSLPFAGAAMAAQVAPQAKAVLEKAKKAWGSRRSKAPNR